MYSKDHKKIINRLFRINSVLLLFFHSISTIIIWCIKENISEYKEIAAPFVFILCFDFIFLFYIDNNSENIYTNSNKQNNGKKIIIIILSIVLSFSGIHFSETVFLVPLFLFASVLLSGCIRFESGIILTTGITAYTAAFLPSQLSSFVPYILMAVLMCIMVNFLSSKASLFYTIETVTIVYIAVMINSSKFILINMLSIQNGVMYALYMLLIIGVYFQRKKRISFDKALEEADELLLSNDTEKTESVVEQQSKKTTDDVTTVNIEIFQKNKSDFVGEQVNDNKIVLHDEETDRLKKEIEVLKNENQLMKGRIDNLFKQTSLRIGELASDNSLYIKKLKREAPKLYKHCYDVAILSSEAASLISCDHNQAYVIAIYHEAARFIHENTFGILKSTYGVPEHIINSIKQMKDKKNSFPVSRETGIVMLSDDIYTTFMYLNSRNKDDVSPERIITNTFKVRKEQNLLRLAGFSLEEVQLLKLYFNDKGNFDDITS